MGYLSLNQGKSDVFSVGYSRSGFKQSVVEAAEECDDLRLSTVDDLVRTLSDRSCIHRPAV